MTTLTFTRTEDPTLGDTFALTGPEGAITFHPGTTNGIEIHSVAPLYEYETPSDAKPCTYTATGTCHTDGSSLAGRALRQQWDTAGDDGVVRAELTDWYNAHLARAPR